MVGVASPTDVVHLDCWRYTVSSSTPQVPDDRTGERRERWGRHGRRHGRDAGSWIGFGTRGTVASSGQVSPPFGRNTALCMAGWDGAVPTAPRLLVVSAGRRAPAVSVRSARRSWPDVHVLTETSPTGHRRTGRADDGGYSTGTSGRVYCPQPRGDRGARLLRRHRKVQLLTASWDRDGDVRARPGDRSSYTTAELAGFPPRLCSHRPRPQRVVWTFGVRADPVPGRPGSNARCGARPHRPHRDPTRRYCPSRATAWENIDAVTATELTSE